jgi:hypothetical protein
MARCTQLLDDKMKNKKYHNVRTISKYNRKIVETEIFGEKLSHLSFC